MYIYTTACLSLLGHLATELYYILLLSLCNYQIQQKKNNVQFYPRLPYIATVIFNVYLFTSICKCALCRSQYRCTMSHYIPVQEVGNYFSFLCQMRLNERRRYERDYFSSAGTVPSQHH